MATVFESKSSKPSRNKQRLSQLIRAVLTNARENWHQESFFEFVFSDEMGDGSLQVFDDL
jgi:hypothetical protein